MTAWREQPVAPPDFSADPAPVTPEGYLDALAAWMVDGAQAAPAQLRVGVLEARESEALVFYQLLTPAEFPAVATDVRLTLVRQPGGRWEAGEAEVRIECGRALTDGRCMNPPRDEP